MAQSRRCFVSLGCICSATESSRPTEETMAESPKTDTQPIRKIVHSPKMYTVRLYTVRVYKSNRWRSLGTVLSPSDAFAVLLRAQGRRKKPWKRVLRRTHSPFVRLYTARCCTQSVCDCTQSECTNRIDGAVSALFRLPWMLLQCY